MIDAVRSRIRDTGGSPNEALARVLFKLVAEEDAEYLENKIQKMTSKRW
jgi:hypothetical protein